MIPRFATRSVSFLCAVLVTGCAKSYTDEELVQATAQLRDLLYSREFERGVSEGHQWLARAPNAQELRAWFVHHLALNERRDSAIHHAEAMVRRDPTDAWSWFALGGALQMDASRRQESLDATERAFALAPGSIDMARLRAEILTYFAAPSRALAFMDSLPPDVRNDPVMLVRRGEALYFESYFTLDAKSKEQALQAYALAREKDPANVDANFFPGLRLQHDREIDAALPLLERAVSLTRAPEAYEYLWMATLGRRDLSTDEKNAIVEAGVDSLLAVRGETPRTLQAAVETYRNARRADKRKEYEDRILEVYPSSAEAEWVLLYRIYGLSSDVDRLEDSSVTAPVVHEAYRTALREFINRPYHHSAYQRGSAYMFLFEVAKNDSALSDDDLYDLVRGMAPMKGYYPEVVFGQGAIALADRKMHLEEAAELTQSGLEWGKLLVDELNDLGYYETEGEYQYALDRASSRLQDALGWVRFNQGRIDEAERELLAAHDLDPDNFYAPYHLGRLYESRATEAGDGGALGTRSAFLRKAEEHYVRGAIAPPRSGTENPNDAALETLYEERNGSLDGFEVYRANIEEMDRERRHMNTLAERIADPQPVAPFSLMTPAGDVVMSQDVVGRVAVVNFWATWCAPCVLEMPEFQRFHDQYDGDDQVVVLTINMDYNPDDVLPWMQKHGYNFPVLLDDGYVERVGFNVFPTTWFIDRNGRIAFAKKGWSESLAEEFGWRVEALRRSGS